MLNKLSVNMAKIPMANIASYLRLGTNPLISKIQFVQGFEYLYDEKNMKNQKSKQGATDTQLAAIIDYIKRN